MRVSGTLSAKSSLQTDRIGRAGLPDLDPNPGLSMRTLLSAPPSSSPPSSSLLELFDSGSLPSQLGGRLRLGERGRCCAGVEHHPISHVLGRATLLRTFRDVPEAEARSVSELTDVLMKERYWGSVLADGRNPAKVFPPHVGGEVALLRWLRANDGDVGGTASAFLKSLTLRSEGGVDEAHEAIAKQSMSCLLYTSPSPRDRG